MNIPEKGRDAVTEVTMDLSDSMRAVAEGAFPKARITLDVFHMMKRCIDGLEELRLKLKREAQAETFNSKIKAFRAQLRGVTDIPFFMFRLCKIFG